MNAMPMHAALELVLWRDRARASFSSQLSLSKSGVVLRQILLMSHMSRLETKLMSVINLSSHLIGSRASAGPGKQPGS